MSRPTIHSLAERSVRYLNQADLLGGWALTGSNTVYLAREGWTVHMLAAYSSAGLNGTEATADDFMTIPAGYRPDARSTDRIGWLTGANGAPVQLRSAPGNRLSLPARSLVWGIVSWPTTNPWPNT